MTTALLNLEGEPSGGLLDVYIQPERGPIIEVQVASLDGEPLRVLAERVVEALEASGLGRPAEIDRAEQLIVINGAVDADLISDDPGVFASVWLDEREVVADNRIRGSAVSDPPSTAVTLPDPDIVVLDHLGRYVSALADNATAAVDLVDEIKLNQTLYFEIMRSLIEGRNTLDLPNPGTKAERTASDAQALAIANQVGDHAAKMSKNAGGMSDARGKQVEAIEAKEREAKSGAGGSEQGSKVAKPGAIASANRPDGSDIEESDAPGGAGGGDNNDSLPDGTILVRDADSDSGFATAIPIEELTSLRGRGLEFIVGRIGDQWYLSTDRRLKEYVVDGKTLVRNDYHFGDFSSKAPEEDRPIPVDLDDLVARLGGGGKPAEGSEEPSTAESVLSLALDLIPIIGDIKGVVEVVIGRDLVTNRELSTTERALGAALMLIPFAGRIFRTGAKATLRTTGSVVRAGGQIAEASTRKVDDAIEALARRRRADGNSVVRRRLDDVDQGPLRAPAYGRAGCFSADTLVRTDSGWVDIASLRIDDRIVAAANSVQIPNIELLQPAKVVSIKRQLAQEAVRLEIANTHTQERALITCTPRHSIATTVGFVAAVELADHHRLLLADGEAKLIERKAVDPIEVVNIEVDEHHTFFVSELSLLVHNYCEKISQQHLDRELGQIMDHAHVRADGTPILEPAYKNGQFLGYGHRSTFAERAEALGVRYDGTIPIPESVRRRVNQLSENTTKPDYAGNLNRQWGDLPPGTRVNVELKTIKDTKFGTRQTIYQQMRQLGDGGSRNKGSLLTQAGMRTRQTPGEHVLVIDVSYAQGFSPGAIDAQVRQALGELQTVINARNLPYGGADGLASVYSRVAFMVQDASGILRVSAPVPMPVRI